MLRGTPQSFWLMAAGVPLSVFLAWAEIKLPALVISEVTAGQTFRHAALAVGILLGATLAATVLSNFCCIVLNAYASRYRFRQSVRLEKKPCTAFTRHMKRKKQGI